MIYILTGEENFLVENKLNEIINEKKDSLLTRFNGNEKSFNIDDVLGACKNVNLFNPTTLVLVKDAPFLINKGGEEVEKILDYCDSPLYENDLVFYTLENKFNERLKAYKDISKNAQVIKFNKPKRNEYYNLCIDLLKKRNIKISKESANYLINSCNNSLQTFSQNLDVLELYPETINNDVINAILISANYDDIFALINALTNKKISQSISFSRKLLKADDNIFGLISMLGMQLRFLYEVSYYNNLNLSTNEIMDRIGTTSAYRIEKAFESLSYLRENEILRLLDKLSDLDYSLKTNDDIDSHLQFELFITSMVNNNG